jgi:hypothetical protein
MRLPQLKSRTRFHAWRAEGDSCATLPAPASIQLTAQRHSGTLTVEIVSRAVDRLLYGDGESIVGQGINEKEKVHCVSEIREKTGSPRDKTLGFGNGKQRQVRDLMGKKTVRMLYVGNRRQPMPSTSAICDIRSRMNITGMSNSFHPS